MVEKEALSQQIQSAFAGVEYPGDSNLRNSNEGDEPYLLEAEFKGKDDWEMLSAVFIDQAPDGFASALSFFSHAAFRFYLPAYLLADLDRKLLHTDPIFNLTHGLTETSREVFVNPLRYAELTWFNYASERFAGFTLVEAQAIVAYLKYKREHTELDMERTAIDDALNNYWLGRVDSSAN